MRPFLKKMFLQKLLRRTNLSHTSIPVFGNAWIRSAKSSSLKSFGLQAARRGKFGKTMLDLTFYKGRKVFVTGHTGFKGAWLCKILSFAGADVTGYALEPPTNPNLFTIADIAKDINSVIGDIRDYDKLKQVFNAVSPEIVIHMAAQPLVLESYIQPKYTYETNVLGTVNILECVRNSSCVKSFLNVTTDKVYLNRDLNNAFEENEQLDGFDPYSNSKSCSELVTHCYKNSFFADGKIAVSTARAGNVIGGGDFSEHRIIPDCVRAVMSGREIVVRNPDSVRPYQHVLEPLFAYLLLTKKQYFTPELAGCYNIGPDDCGCISTGQLADLFCKYWGEKISWEAAQNVNVLCEAGFLRLNCDKIKRNLGWKPLLNADEAVKKTVNWTKAWLNGEDIQKEINLQIEEYRELFINIAE